MSLSHRQIDWLSHVNSYTNRRAQSQERTHSHSTPAVVGAQRPGEGALWALRATTAPPSAPFVRSQNQKPVCQTAHALRTTQLSAHEDSSGPHIPGFPCFIKGAHCSLSARSGCPPCTFTPAQRAGWRVTTGASPGWQPGKSWPMLGALLPSHGTVLLGLQFQKASWALKCQTFQLSSPRNTRSVTTGCFLRSQGK